MSKRSKCVVRVFLQALLTTEFAAAKILQSIFNSGILIVFQNVNFSPYQRDMFKTKQQNEMNSFALQGEEMIAK